MTAKQRIERLSASRYPEFDRAFAENLKQKHPELWRKGGNIRGNQAYELWEKARSGEYTPEVIAWVREREAWIARHYRDFRLAGIIAQLKWGTIGCHGEDYMKGVLEDELQKKTKKNRTNKTPKKE
jgi:hypothetical protein